MPAYPLPRVVANQLVRCLRAEADIMRVLGGWTARVTENDERLAFARDIGLRAEHADALLSRLHRLRVTSSMIHTPDEPWRTLIELLDNAPGAAELVAGAYQVVTAELARSYRLLAAHTDPLADEPTLRLLSRHLLPDAEAQLAWSAAYLRTHPADPGYVLQVRSALHHAGGLVARDDRVPDEQPGKGTGFWPLTRPAPEAITLGSEYRIAEPGEPTSACPPNDQFGPVDVEVLVNHHGLMPEIASLCIIGTLLHDVHDKPWEFYRDFATQCADEVRHIGLLVRRLSELGAREDTHAFPTWTFYDAVSYLPVEERTLVFNAIVEGNVVETLHDRADALERAGNPSTAHVMDWISADESLHLHNGMRWLGEGDLTVEEIDALLSRGSALLGQVMRQKDTSEKVFDANSIDLGAGDFYAPRRNRVAPIARELGGFAAEQIDKLVVSAGGRTVRR